MSGLSFSARPLAVLLSLSLLLSAPAGAVQLVDGPSDSSLNGRIQLAVESFKVLDVYPDRTFQGSRPFSRYELADALNRTLVYLNGKHQIKIATDPRTRMIFNAYLKPSGDIPRQHWAAEAIHRSLAFGLMSGEQDLAFRGSLKVTRYQLALSLWRVLDWLRVSPMVMNAPPANDVPTRHWAGEAVRRLVESGVMTPDARGRFNGDQPATRYELAEALVRVLQQVDLIAEKGELHPKVVVPLPETILRPRADGRRYPYPNTERPSVLP
ncbi:MAG: S-layer homology domain-containing protein [Candidatus Sericytochromatia bacterium]